MVKFGPGTLLVQRESVQRLVSQHGNVVCLSYLNGILHEEAFLLSDHGLQSKILATMARA